MNEPRETEISQWEERLRAHGECPPDGLGDRVLACVQGELKRGSRNGAIPSLGWMIASLAWLNLSLGIVQLAQGRPLLAAHDRALARKASDDLLQSIDVNVRRYLEARQ